MRELPCKSKCLERGITKRREQTTQRSVKTRTNRTDEGWRSNRRPEERPTCAHNSGNRERRLKTRALGAPCAKVSIGMRKITKSYRARENHKSCARLCVLTFDRCHMLEFFHSQICYKTTMITISR
jgi:hypothetical protein